MTSIDAISESEAFFINVDGVIRSPRLMVTNIEDIEE